MIFHGSCLQLSSFFGSKFHETIISIRCTCSLEYLVALTFSAVIDKAITLISPNAARWGNRVARQNLA